MPARFLPSAATTFQRGRPAGLLPAAVVLHRSGGSRDALLARFNDRSSQISAHYIVGRDGGVDQCVREGDTAFHAGLADGATWPLLRSGVNTNFYTIGVELEGLPDADWPDAQVQAAGTLIAEICRRWQIPIDDAHVIRHSAVRASSGCPAASCPVARMLEIARAATPEARRPQSTVVRTVVRANLREGAPSSQARIAQVIEPGTNVFVAAFTDSGEPVQGNAFWYVDLEGRCLWAGATDIPNPIDASTTGAGTTDAMDLQPLPIGTPVDTTTGLKVDRAMLALPESQFIPEIVKKDLIVLHFTAGRTARSAFDTWRGDSQRVGTAYIVDLDGTIYEVFPPARWAFHLGVSGTNGVHDRRSIGIEMVNVGPLQPSADDPAVLNWWPRRAPDAPEFTAKFCTLADTDRYVKTDFRGKSHFAAFPVAQVDAVAALVRALCSQFAIPASLPPVSNRFTADVKAFSTYSGVCSHANFRQDKWDIGPAFPWDRLGL